MLSLLRKPFKIGVAICLLSVPFGVLRLHQSALPRRWLKADFVIREGELDELGARSSWYYFGQGTQAQVFLSEDRKYVLKVFCSKPKRFIAWRRSNPWAALSDVLLKQSLRLAMESRWEGMQVLSWHLDSVGPHETTLHISPLYSVTVNLDKYIYVIQKRGTLARDYIQALYSARDWQNLDVALASWCGRVDQRLQLGLATVDPDLGRNWGFIDQEPVELDLGSYRRIPKDSTQQSLAASEFRRRLQHWVRKHCPEYRWEETVLTPDHTKYQK